MQEYWKISFLNNFPGEINYHLKWGIRNNLELIKKGKIIPDSEIVCVLQCAYSVNYNGCSGFKEWYGALRL